MMMTVDDLNNSKYMIDCEIQSNITRENSRGYDRAYGYRIKIDGGDECLEVGKSKIMELVSENKINILNRIYRENGNGYLQFEKRVYDAKACQNRRKAVRDLFVEGFRKELARIASNYSKVVKAESNGTCNGIDIDFVSAQGKVTFGMILIEELTYPDRYMAELYVEGELVDEMIIETQPGYTGNVPKRIIRIITRYGGIAILEKHIAEVL